MSLVQIFEAAWMAICNKFHVAQEAGSECISLIMNDVYFLLWGWSALPRGDMVISGALWIGPWAYFLAERVF